MNDIILLALLLDGPRYGYQLKKDAGVLLGGAPMHNNLVYPLLAKFRARGWVRRREVPGGRGQTRQLYTLTASGKAEVLRRLRAFSEKDAAAAPAFQLRVALFSVLDAKARREILAAREKALLNKKARLEGIAAHFAMQKFARAVIALRAEQTRAELSWLRRLRRMR